MEITEPVEVYLFGRWRAWRQKHQRFQQEWDFCYSSYSVVKLSITTSFVFCALLLKHLLLLRYLYKNICSCINAFEKNVLIFLFSKLTMNYKITLETGSLCGAGTDASISIKLTGIARTFSEYFIPCILIGYNWVSIVTYRQ